MPRGASHSVALVAARYELVHELRGSSETVEWEAFDIALERRVVVELLRPELAHDTVATERFWQEARVAARRTGVVGNRVLDAGTDPETGRLFVVRELPASAPPPPLATDAHRVVRREPSSLASLLSRFPASPRWLVLTGLAVVLVLVGVTIKPGVEGWLAWVNQPLARTGQGLGLAPPVAVPASGAQPGQSTATPAAAPATVSAAARSGQPAPTAATANPTREATPTPATGQTRRVVNTDGQGVALRAAPGGDRLPGKGYDEGATVQAFEQSAEWTHIRGTDGREGWVLTVTLAP